LHIQFDRVWHEWSDTILCSKAYGWLTEKEVEHLKSYLLSTKYLGLMCTSLLE